MPEVRIDAVAQGDALSLDLAEELQQLAPVRHGQPAGLAARPGRARCPTRSALGEGRHVALHARAPAAPARAAWPSAPARRCRSRDGEPADAAVRLEIDRWNGAVSPRLVLRRAQPCRPRAIDVLGEPATFADGLLRELDRDLAGGDAAPAGAAAALRGEPARSAADSSRDLRGTGIAGPARRPRRLAASRCSPWPRTRRIARARSPPRVGGFALTSWAALEDDPGLAAPFAHVVARRPAAARRCCTIRPGRAGPTWRGVRLN